MSGIVSAVLSGGAIRDRGVELGSFCLLELEMEYLIEAAKIVTSYSQFNKIIKSMRKAGQKPSKKLISINNELYNMKWRCENYIIESDKMIKEEVEIFFSDLDGIDYALFQCTGDGEVLLTHV